MTTELKINPYFSSGFPPVETFTYEETHDWLLDEPAILGLDEFASDEELTKLSEYLTLKLDNQLSVASPHIKAVLWRMRSGSLPRRRNH